MFKQMSILKNKNRKKLVELHKKKFGETLIALLTKKKLLIISKENLNGW